MNKEEGHTDGDVSCAETSGFTVRFSVANESTLQQDESVAV